MRPGFSRSSWGAHRLKSLERNILQLCGITPVHDTLIGMVEASDEAGRGRWLDELRELGRDAK